MESWTEIAEDPRNRGEDMLIPDESGHMVHATTTRSEHARDNDLERLKLLLDQEAYS